MKDAVHAVLKLYPKIFHACHQRHVRDPETRELVSAHQAGILDHLDQVEGVGLVDLAKHMGVTPATMSASVDRLAALGYVLRERDTGDARRVRIRLTESGLRIRNAQSVLEPELVDGMLSLLNADERKEALRGLELLARAADELQHARSREKSWARRSKGGKTPDE